MSQSPASSGGDVLFRAFVVLVALVALMAAIHPDMILPHLVRRGLINLSTPSAAQTLHWARMGTGALAGLLLLIYLGRPLVADWRAYRRRLKLAREERADAARVLGEIEGRNPALLISLVLFSFVAFAFLVRDGLVDQLVARDGLADTATAIFYVVAIVLTVFEIVRQAGAKQRVGLQRWWLLVIAAGFILVAGEELDWGRVPAPLAPGAGAEAGLEPEASRLQQIPVPVVTTDMRLETRVLESDLVLRAVAALFGIALPLLMLAFPSIARWWWAVGAPLPSRLVQVGFAVAALIPSNASLAGWFGYESTPSELRELLCGGMFLLLIWQTVRSNCVAEPRPAALARL